MAYTVNNSEASAKMAHREEFRNSTGSLHGGGESYTPDRGYMPAEAYEALRQAFVPGTYVVFSYDTPIAWAVPGAGLLTVPDVRYSNTTSRHQSACVHGNYRSGVGHIGERVTYTDPGAFRKGKGHTPFGPLGGAW